MDKLKTQRGFSILEILIAMAIAIMTMSAVFLVSFGNQSTILGGQTNAEAVTKAQQLLEQEQALAREDFNLVNPSGPTVDGIYTKTVSVETLSDFVTKLVTVNISWTGDGGQLLSTTLSTLVTNTDNVNSPNECNSVLSGDWSNPQMLFNQDLNSILGVNGGNGFALSGITADSGKLYLTASQIPGSYHDGFTFFIFDITTNPLQPAYLGGADSVDLNAVAIGGNYAYAAASNSAQLRVIDISNPNAPFFATSTKAAGMTGNQLSGDSIFYYNGYVYLGLKAAGFNNGPEFHIFNVQNPLAPVEVGSWPAAGVNFNNDINAIYVKGNYAYLAHPQDSIYGEQLTVLDISNPSNPQRVSGFFANGASGGNGKSLALVGNTLYLGRTATKLSGTNDTIPEFYMLNDTFPTAIPNTPIDSLPLPTSGDSINGLSVRDNLAFFITNKQFQVWNISNTSNPPIPWSPDGTTGSFLPLPSGQGTSVDCTNNYFYVISQSSQGNQKDLLSVVVPGVAKVNPTITTEIDDSSHIATTTVAVGTAVHDKATLSGSSGTPTGTVNFTYYTDGVCTTDATAAGTGIALVSGVADPSSTETPPSVGAYSFKVHYDGDSTYNSADGACEPLTVIKATPTITWANPAAITYGTALSATQLNASTGVLGNFTYNPPSGTVLDVGSNQSLVVHFAPTDTADYNTPPPDKTVFITVNKANQTITVTTHAPASKQYGLTFPVAATSTSGLSIAITTSGGCTISGTTVTMTSGTTACVVSYNQAGNSNYNAATQVTDTTTATKASPTAISTTIFNASTNLAIAHAPAGTSVYDKATVTGGFGVPTGTVTFTVSTNKTSCKNPTQSGGTSTLISGVAKSSPNYMTSGNSSYSAVYSGDTNYNAITASCEALPAP